MAKYEYTKHAYDMFMVRNINEMWVNDAIDNPERIEAKEDGTVHYIKRVIEFGGRYLRVVVNQDSDTKKIVTLFFDRKLGGKL